MSENVTEYEIIFQISTTYQSKTLHFLPEDEETTW